MSIAVLLSLALASSEPAVPETQSAAPPAPPTLTAGLKLGGIFPQVMSRLSTSYSLGVEVGWVVPALNRQLAVALECAYSAPPRTFTVEDPRVSGGSYTVTITERTVGLYLGPKYYLLPVRGTLVPWASVGLRVQLIDSQVVGGAGQAFGQHDETGTHLAFGGQVGVGYRLGPGFVGLELQLISSPLDHLVTGRVDVGDLAVRAAYHFTF